MGDVQGSDPLLSVESNWEEKLLRKLYPFVKNPSSQSVRASVLQAVEALIKQNYTLQMQVFNMQSAINTANHSSTAQGNETDSRIGQLQSSFDALAQQFAQHVICQKLEMKFLKEKASESDLALLQLSTEVKERDSYTLRLIKDKHELQTQLNSCMKQIVPISSTASCTTSNSTASDTSTTSSTSTTASTIRQWPTRATVPISTDHPVHVPVDISLHQSASTAQRHCTPNRGHVGLLKRTYRAAGVGRVL